MIDEPEFERRLFVWLDGELPSAQADEMEAYCSAHPAARERADAERKFEARVVASLLTGGVGGRAVVAQALQMDRGAVTASPARSRMVRLPRIAAGIAALVLASTAFAWFSCIPPFECPFVSALEGATHAMPPSGTGALEGCPVDRALAAAGATIRSEASVRLAVGGLEQIEIDAVRRTASCGDLGAIDVFSFRCAGEKPSCRNKRQVGNETWWVGEENDRRVVCVPGCKEGDYVAIIGPQTEETLLKLASTLRCSLAPQQ